MILNSIRHRSLFLYALLFALSPLSLWAQGVEVSIGGIVGVNNVTVGNEILIYNVQVRDTVNGNPVSRIGGVPVVGEGIIITLSDLTAPTAIAAADFTGLNLYRSTDAILDGGDTFLKTVAPVNIGAITAVDFQAVGNANRTLPEPADVPDRIFFLITAVIAPGATPGHAFRLGAAANHIDVRDTGGGPPVDYNIGSAIVAADANRVVIQAAGGGGSSSGSGSLSSAGAESGRPNQVVEIPFGGEWLFALCGLLYGTYLLYRKP